MQDINDNNSTVDIEEHIKAKEQEIERLNDLGLVKVSAYVKDPKQHNKAKADNAKRQQKFREKQQAQAMIEKSAMIEKVDIAKRVESLTGLKRTIVYWLLKL